MSQDTAQVVDSSIPAPFSVPTIGVPVVSVPVVSAPTTRSSEDSSTPVYGHSGSVIWGVPPVSTSDKIFSHLPKLDSIKNDISSALNSQFAQGVKSEIGDFLTSEDAQNLQEQAIDKVEDLAEDIAENVFHFALPTAGKSMISGILKNFFNWVTNFFVTGRSIRDPRWEPKRDSRAVGSRVTIRGELPQGQCLSSVFDSFTQAIPLLPPGTHLGYAWEDGCIEIVV